MFQKRRALSTRINLYKYIWYKVYRITHFYNFSRRQNVPLTVRSQYRYQVKSKIFLPNKVRTKIYILPCAHISFKISMSWYNQLAPPHRTKGAPRGAGRTVWEPLVYSIVRYLSLTPIISIKLKLQGRNDSYAILSLTSLNPILYEPVIHFCSLFPLVYLECQNPWNSG
jgi:hypothetical protein